MLELLLLSFLSFPLQLLIYLSVKFKFIYPYELFYHVTAIYTRTVPAELPAGTETVLRTLAIWCPFSFGGIGEIWSLTTSDS